MGAPEKRSWFYQRTYRQVKGRTTGLMSMSDEQNISSLSVMRPSCVGKYVAAMAWTFTLSLVVVAGPTQPPPSRIGPVSPLIHSVSNPPDVDKGVGSIGRWGRGGYEFSGGALHLWSHPHAGVFVCWHFLWTRSFRWCSGPRPRIPAGQSLPYQAVGCGSAICCAVWGASRAGGGSSHLGQGLGRERVLLKETRKRV